MLRSCRRPLGFHWLLLLAALGLVAGCGGSDTDAAVAVGGGGGTVIVVVTDGPVDPDAFSHIFVTFTGITLIGDDGQVRIFDGRETVDLRDVEDTSTLLSVGRDVPADDYEKIRLDVAEIELVSADDGSSSFPKLPPKIDLNPRGGFEVDDGETVLVQIDMDAGKSIHIVETGNGGLRFRPVIFVDILTGADPGKLVLLQGEVEEVDAGGFLLCDTHAVSRQQGGTRVMARRGDDDDDDDDGDDGDDDDDDDDGDDGDDDDRDDFCVDVRVDGDTSFFDENGDPADLGDVDAGDPASVLGRFEPAGEELRFEGEVVMLGDDVLALDGDVASEVGADDRFDLELDAGQGIVTDDGLLAIALQPGTRIFTREGDELDPEDLAVGDPARALGVLALSSSDDDVLKAGAVVVDVEAGDEAQIEGEITDVVGGGARILVDTEESGSECVDVPSSADLFAITSDAGSAHVDAIDRSQLREGDQVSVFGEPDGECLEAETVIVLDEE